MQKRTKKLIAGLTIIAVITVPTIFLGNDVFIMFEGKSPSESIGMPSNGRLTNGKRLPTKGANFKAYSRLGTLLGRNSVHDKVRSAVVDAYAILATKKPGKVFVYGETGWPGGGSFKPHKTHQNGLSVDFMVPVIDKNGHSVPLPASIFNKYGYAIEFDSTGVTEDFQIDFETMAAHIYELDVAAKGKGLRINKVIFDPNLQPYLFDTSLGRIIRDSTRFSDKRSWVRHDEHYHVDFQLDQ